MFFISILFLAKQKLTSFDSNKRRKKTQAVVVVVVFCVYAYETEREKKERQTGNYYCDKSNLPTKKKGNEEEQPKDFIYYTI